MTERDGTNYRLLLKIFDLTFSTFTLIILKYVGVPPPYIFLRFNVYAGPNHPLDTKGRKKQENFAEVEKFSTFIGKQKFSSLRPFLGSFIGAPKIFWPLRVRSLGSSSFAHRILSSWTDYVFNVFNAPSRPRHLEF